MPFGLRKWIVANGNVFGNAPSISGMQRQLERGLFKCAFEMVSFCQNGSASNTTRLPILLSMSPFLLKRQNDVVVPIFKIR